MEEYERKIKSLVGSFKTALTEYKKYEKDLKAQIETGDENTREAAQLEFHQVHLHLAMNILIHHTCFQLI